VPRARIDAVFKPRSIALVGASDRPGTLGDLIRRNLEATGFKGRVEYVNPARAEIAGRPSFGSVRDLPEPTDVAIIVTPAATIPQIITDCGETGIHGAIIVSAGFRDGGDAGRALEDHLYLVDPMGEWMMRMPADPDPAKVKRDLDRLLRASASWDQPGR